MLKKLDDLKDLIDKYEVYKKERISLIATENVTSNLHKFSYLLGLNDQYGSRLPENAEKVGNLSFGNIQTIDDINRATRELIKKIFHVEQCDARLLSGVNGLTILLYSLLERGDVLLKMSDECGGHLSVKPIAKKIGAKVVEMKYDEHYVLDIKDFKKKFELYKPKVIFLDSSYMIAKYPVQQIKQIVGNKSIIVYDASHVISLIASNKFQNPLAEGADIIHSTTHKMLWGPQKAILLFKENNDIAKKIMTLVGDVLVSNTHLHHVMALFISLKELEAFGNEFAETLVSNNRYFAKCLYEKGFNVIGKEFNYTETNQFWIKFENFDKAKEAFKKLEEINISTNLIFLPKGQWGLRIGTNELTRLGMKHDYIEKLAELFKNAILEDYDKFDLLIKSKALANELSTLHVKFSFDDTVEGKLIMNQIAKRYGYIKEV